MKKEYRAALTFVDDSQSQLSRRCVDPLQLDFRFVICHEWRASRKKRAEGGDASKQEPALHVSPHPQPTQIYESDGVGAKTGDSVALFFRQFAETYVQIY